MSSSAIYENLPLATSKKDEKENEETDLNESSVIKTLQNTIYTNNNPKNRKSAPEIQKLSQNSGYKGRPKPSRSITEMFFRSGRRHKEVNENVEKTNQNVLKEPNDVIHGTEVDDVGGKDSDTVDEEKKLLGQKGTPTSNLDDGYESCNSTPLGSGKFNFGCSTLYKVLMVVRILD